MEKDQSLQQGRQRAGFSSDIIILVLAGRSETWSHGHITCMGASLLAPILILPSGLSSFGKITESRCLPGCLGSPSPVVLGARPRLRALLLRSFSFPVAGQPSKPSANSGSALTYAASACGPGCAKMSGFLRDLGGGS